MKTHAEATVSQEHAVVPVSARASFRDDLVRHGRAAPLTRSLDHQLAQSVAYQERMAAGRQFDAPLDYGMRFLLVSLGSCKLSCCCSRAARRRHAGRCAVLVSPVVAQAT